MKVCLSGYDEGISFSIFMDRIDLFKVFKVFKKSNLTLNPLFWVSKLHIQSLYYTIYWSHFMFMFMFMFYCNRSYFPKIPEKIQWFCSVDPQKSVRNLWRNVGCHGHPPSSPPTHPDTQTYKYISQLYSSIVQ